MPAPKKKPVEPPPPKADDPVETVARWIHDVAGESCGGVHYNTGKPWPTWDNVTDQALRSYRTLAARLLADPPAELVRKIMLG